MAETVFKNGSSSKFQLIVKTATGSIVTATKSGVTKNAKEKNGIWCFKGLDSGSWVITCSNGSRTVTKTVDIEDGACILMEIGYRSIPEFTYTGNYEIVTDDDQPISNPDSHQGNWKIRFLTSGVLKFKELFSAENGIDVFLVGGGSGSVYWAAGSGSGYRKGQGGYTECQYGVSVVSGSDIYVEIGAGSPGASSYGSTQTSGGSTSFGAISASGGDTQASSDNPSVYEFNTNSGLEYSDGNTGENSGGGAFYNNGGDGYSGIVIIRNKR